MGNLGNLGCKCGARVRATRVKTAIIWLSHRTHPTMHSICRYYTENFKFLQEFSTRALQLQTSYKTHERSAKMWFSWTPHVQHWSTEGMIMSGRLCRKMILGPHIMHCIMLYTHTIMHYAAGKFWPLVPGGGARSTYQTDFEPWCLNWQHIPILATMCVRKITWPGQWSCHQTNSIRNAATWCEWQLEHKTFEKIIAD